MKTDIDLQRDVLDEIAWEPSLRAPEIGVTVSDGIVTLTGSVDNFPAKWAAENAALRVAGVWAVVNDVEVELSTEDRRTDEDIARAASEALEWHILLPNNLPVVVDDGWITLTGKVHWQFQKIAAEETVMRLAGVTGVTNHITVEPQASPSVVNIKIEADLQSRAASAGGGIHVKNEDGKVTLEGTVDTWAEKKAAEEAAWSAPGVTQVDNKISVRGGSND